MTGWFRRRAAAADPPPAPAVVRATVPAAPVRVDGHDRASLVAAAERHLPPAAVERFAAALRPALWLVAAAAGEPAVARLGGEPELPPHEPWPEWPGAGPLSYVGEVFCGAVDPAALDVTLPRDGRLLFFYYDGSYDDAEHLVYVGDPASDAGVRVVHVPDTAVSARRPTPPGLAPYRERLLTARPVATYPDLGELAFALAEEGVAGHAAFDDLGDELADLTALPKHQLGGHPAPVQNAVEDEIAAMEVSRNDRAAHAAEIARWMLVLQVDTDDDLEMMWGDCGTLYWLARRDELTGGVPRLRFTWQCS